MTPRERNARTIDLAIFVTVVVFAIKYIYLFFNP